MPRFRAFSPLGMVKEPHSPIPPSPDVCPESGAAPKPKAGLFLNPYLQIFLCVLLSTAAQIFMKKGADESVHSAASFTLGFSGLHSTWVWAGIGCMIASLVSWLYALRFVQLIIAFNLAGLCHVFVPLVSWFYLGESIGGVRWLGIGLVFAGVLVVARPIIKLEEL